MRQLQSIFREKKPIIGMVHLRPLPGSPMYDPASMDMTKILEIAVDEAKKLQDAGVDGVQVENMWDIPYNRPEDIGYETAAALAVGIYEVGKHVSIPVGGECHMVPNVPWRALLQQGPDGSGCLNGATRSFPSQGL